MFSSYMLWLGCLAAVVSAELPPTHDNGTIFELPIDDDDLSLTGPPFRYDEGVYLSELVVMNMSTDAQCHGILFVTSPDRVFETDIVVTTAFCLRQLKVEVGDTILDVRVEILSNTTYLSRTATVVAIHPCFQAKGYIADMAVIKLNEPYANTALGVFNSNDNIPELNGDRLYAFGYGIEGRVPGVPNQYPKTLRGITMDYLRGCRDSLFSVGVSYYNETHLCAVDAFKGGPCIGDGGIPIYAIEDYYVGEGNYTYVAVGLFTFFTRDADQDEEFCKTERPVGFTRIRRFYDWVVDIECTNTSLVPIPSYCATRKPPNTDCPTLPTEPGNVDSASCRSATSMGTYRNLKPWEMAYQNLKSWVNRMGMAISSRWNS